MTARRLALVFVLLFAVAVPGAEPRRPNILLILTDDQGYGDVGRHGHPLLKTPHQDALHDQSVRFQNFYVSPSCSPTRAALMTGMHEFRSGVTHTTDPREHLDVNAVVLPQLLKGAGYRTGFIGKWHLGNDGPYAPDKRGFDWCSTNAGAATVHFDPVITRNRKRTTRQGYREDVLFDEAMAFIDEAKGAPFFCYLATYSPHAPLKAPDVFKAPFVGKVDAEEADFLGMVANLDYNLGRILRHVKERGLEKDTIVVWMNDNGETHGLDVYNAGMRGCKATAWQGGSRAMSFWKWPDRWPPHTAKNLTAHLDVLPTLCDVAGVKIPAELGAKLEGWSLRPLLESTGDLPWHDDRLLFHHVGRWPSGLAASHKYAMAAVQSGDLLLIRSEPCGDKECEQYGSQCTTLRQVQAGQKRATYTKADAAYHWGVTSPGRWSLYDLAADPKCATDLSAERTTETSRLAAAYDRWWDGLYPSMIANGGDKGVPEKLGGKARK
ncbi:MAG: sulfatase-like hydrolase/transferase [Opitutales bacterium]